MNPNNGNYDFILNSGATKTNKISMGNSPLKKVLIGFGIFVFLIIILIITTSGGGISKATTAFENIVVAQQKIINVSKNDFASNSNNQTTQLTTNQLNSLATITAVLSSDQNQILQYLKKSSVAVPSNITTSVTTTALDTQINTAASSGTLSTIYPIFFQTNLTSYIALIKTCYSLTTGTTGRALLTDMYNNATLLLKQSQN
jgi:hypothetical protein